MKRYTFIKIAVVMIGVHMHVNAEDTPLIKNIDKFTLQEVKTYLERDVESMEAFAKLAENNNIRFSISTAETTEPSFNNKPYKVLDANASNVKIDKFLSDVYIRQYIDYPKSAVLMHLDSYKMEDVFGADKESKNFPSISTQNIVYLDKSQEKINLKAEWEDYNDLYVEVNSSKPIESMKMKISYTLPLVKEYYLSKNNPIVLKEGTIKLENIGGGQVQFSMPNDALKERIVAIDAIHTSGKSLRKSGESMYSYPSKANIAYMKKMIGLLKGITKRIENKGILSSLFGEKSIDSKEALKVALRKIPKRTEEERKQKSFWTYSFAGDIEKVKVVISIGRTAEKTKEIVVKKHLATDSSRLGYYIARDSQTKKEGLVGKDGKWLIQPKYNQLSFLNDYYYNDYYYSDQYKDDPYHLHRLNIKKNILERVDYRISRQKLIDGEFLMTEKIRNEQRGIVNAKTGKTIVPMTYQNIWFKNGLFVANFVDNKNYYIELFNNQGKRLLQKSSKYNRVKIFDVDCIAATRDGEYRYDNKIDILNKKGKILSKGKWNYYKGVFGKSKLLLVGSYKRISKKEKDLCDVFGYEEQYYCDDKVAYIDPKGKVVIDVKKYYEVKDFSNGMAAVRDKETKLWGYLNSKGKLVIPHMYEDAEYFQKQYAYVEKNDEAYFIDKENSIFKKLPITKYSATISIDGHRARYYLYNGQTYNADGRLIDDEIK